MEVVTRRHRPAGGRRRMRRAFSAGSSRAGDGGDTDDDRSGDEWEQRSEGDQRFFIPRVEARELSKRCRSGADKVLAAQIDEREAAEEDVAHLQEEMRNFEDCEAGTAARIAESRELSREQTGLVEDGLQERRRLEAALGARGEEAERLRTSEDVARAAAKAPEGRAEDLLVALRQEKAQTKHDAQAAAAARNEVWNGGAAATAG